MSLFHLISSKKLAPTVLVTPLLLLLIAFFIVSYLIGLPWSPAPLFQDESDGLARALYWASFGQTFEGVRLPTLIPWSGQFYSFPSYFYSIALWSKLFPGNVSFAELRSFGVVCVSFTACLMYVFCRQIRMPAIYALFASLLYVSSPQALLSYRIAWDPILMPFQVLVAVVASESFFKRLAELGPARSRFSPFRFPSWLFSAAAGFACGMLWYGYTAGRLISLLLSLFFILRIVALSHESSRVKYVFSSLFAAGYTLTVLPMCLAIFVDPMAMLRTGQELNQFTLLGVYSSIKSLLSHLTYFDYLIFWGDPQRRHSTGFGGVIGFSGWILLICVVVLFLRANLNAKHDASLEIIRWPVGLVIVYILISTSPSALSFPELHALRSSAAFPFWSILASLFFWRTQTLLFASSGKSHLVYPSTLAVVLCTGIFGLFTLQYMISGSSFLATAQQGSTYPGQSKEYFQNSAYLSASALPDKDVIRRVASMSLPLSTADSRVLFEYFSRRLDVTSNARPGFYAP